MRVAGLLPQSNNTQDSLSHLVLSETGHPSRQGCQVGYYLWEVASISHLSEEKVDHLLPYQEQLCLLWWSEEEEEGKILVSWCALCWFPGSAFLYWKEALLIYSKRHDLGNFFLNKNLDSKEFTAENSHLKVFCHENLSKFDLKLVRCVYVHVQCICMCVYVCVRA